MSTSPANATDPMPIRRNNEINDSPNTFVLKYFILPPFCEKS